MTRLLTLPVAALFVLSVQAITVNINVLQTPTCTHSNGRLRAVPSGGVAPYTYLWSTGATTQIIDGLLPGAYSVTVTDFTGEQASRNITLQAGDYGYMTGTVMNDLFNYGQALCYPWTTVGFPIGWYDLVGPAPYSLGGVQLDTLWVPDDASPWQPDLAVWARPFFNPVYGQMNELVFSDADGCQGIYQVWIGRPVQWPQVTVTAVQGSCQGVASGSVTLSITAEGSNQEVQGMLEPLPQGANGFFSCGNGASTHTITGLPPGDYNVRLYISNASYLPSSGCGTTTNFTIPAAGATCGLVRGTAFLDNNRNCVPNSGEAFVQGSIVEILPGPYYVVTDDAGRYEQVLPYGDYTVEQQSPVFQEHCTGTPIPFTLDVGTPEVIRNLPDTSLAPLDAMVSLSSGIARPGFQFNYAVRSQNLTPTSSGAVTVTFTMDPALVFLSATPNPSSINGNTLVWNQSALGPWQSRSIHVRTQVPPDIGLLGTQLVSTASLATSGTDGNLGNNVASNMRVVTGAYDPNDKLATTSTGSTSDWLLDEDEWIDYTIRFQNTGTDTAFNVLITDTLPANLDPGTIIMGAASHNFTWELRDAGTLKFYFPNILLPDSNINEPRSHGFVGFRIRPRLPLLPGDEITNIANIYFDFNPPVITEPNVLNVVSPIRLDARAWLGGAYDEQTTLMRDDLRTQGLLPITEPYTALAYTHSGDGGGESISTALLTATGPTAIVDWVILELRDPAQPATVLYSRSALLRRDGRITDKDGTSPVAFNAPAGNNHIALRHRNHLGVMSAAPLSFGAVATTWDVSTSTTALHGVEATRIDGPRRLLWPGDVDRNGVARYTGLQNDRDPILLAIGGVVPTAVVTGVYSPLDVNLDGQIKYMGAANDRDLILQTIGGVVPTAVRVQQLP